MTRKKDTRAYILEVARKLISKNGIQGATMRSIAEASSLSTGAIYHYFKSKEEILYAVMDESLSVSSQIAIEARTNQVASEEIIDKISKNIFKRFKKNQENKVQFYLAQEAIMGNNDLKNQFDSKYEEWITMTNELMKFLYKKPDSKYDDAVASLLIGAVDGLVMQLLLGANLASIQDISKVYELLLKRGIPKFLDMIQDIDKTQEK